jgi:hypothetical protein
MCSHDFRLSFPPRRAISTWQKKGEPVVFEQGLALETVPFRWDIDFGAETNLVSPWS